MKSLLGVHPTIISLLFGVSFLMLGVAGQPCRAQDEVDYVDPTIGNVGQLLEPTRPTVSLPNCMIRVYPVRRDGLDDQIHSFPLTIISHRLGELFWLMPDDGGAEHEWSTPRVYDQERSTPYYCSARLEDSLTQIEFSPTEHCGYFSFTFPSSRPRTTVANRQGGDLALEGVNAFTYNWDVAHDLKGLIECMGGQKAATSTLDDLFRVDLGRSKYEYFGMFPDSTGLVGQFVMGNEPSLAISYVYYHLGAPWKTQKRVRQLLEYWFTDTHLGIPGDEDGGGLSAFVVFSMMGVYPVVPGVPAYELGSPVFDRVNIRLHNGKLLRIICQNNSAANKYISSIRFNGQQQNRVWFRQSDIMDGLTVELGMSDAPNLNLGVAPASFPPSSMTLDPATLQDRTVSTAMSRVPR
ncbi:exported hypothetical protein [Verrucomicrobia bacterium]|nr:exported hypothetical protein [Verrucomicrobiota bacterium]